MVNVLFFATLTESIFCDLNDHPPTANAKIKCQAKAGAINGSARDCILPKHALMENFHYGQCFIFCDLNGIHFCDLNDHPPTANATITCQPNAGPGGETVRARVRTRGQQLDSRPRDAIETAIDSIPTCHLTSAVVAQWTEPPPLVRVTQDRIRATADQRVPRNRRGRPEDARESDRRVLWGTVGLNGLRGAVTGAAVRVSRGGESR